MRRARFLSAPLFLLLVAGPSARAQAKHPFTLEDMMALKRVGEPEPSPDGKWVLFTAVEVDLNANTKTPHVWVVPLGKQTPGFSATQDASHPAPVGMTRVCFC
jgi:hypothetical protein